MSLIPNFHLIPLQLALGGKNIFSDKLMQWLYHFWSLRTDTYSEEEVSKTVITAMVWAITPTELCQSKQEIYGEDLIMN